MTAAAPADPTDPTPSPPSTPTTRRRLAVAGIGLLVASVVTFGALAPPEHCPSPTAESLTASADAAVQWFVRNQHPDGTWLYEYDAANDTVTDDYNFVRHAGGIMGLYQAATDDIPGALESADRGTEWALQHTIDGDGWTALAYEGRAPVGATALFVAGLVERRLLTGDETYDDTMRSLGRFLTSQVDETGAVIAQYDAVAMKPELESRSKYYTGEAYWAIARLHRLFPDDEARFGEVADRVGAYLATQRDEVEGHWPPVPDHWVAYGLAETVEFPERDPEQPLTDDELAYARNQAGLFGSQVRWVSQQAGPWGVLARGTRVPRGGGYGVVGEALTGHWRVAQADDRLADIRGPLAERASCIAGLGIETQRGPGEGPGQASMTEGAWFIDGVTRMDDQQHATSALLRTVAIVDAPADSGRDVPPAWLWALVLLTTLNPLYVAIAMPRRPTFASRALLARAGGAVGAVVVVAAALISGPVLNAFNVSLPAVRLAVAIIAIAFAATRLVRRTPGRMDGPPDLGAAAVPVAIPLVATPALVLLGLSAGADLGVAFVIAFMLVSTALMGAAAGWLPDTGRGRTITNWATRAVSVAAIATATLLIINAIFSV